jgi:hypothetical protein
MRRNSFKVTDKQNQIVQLRNYILSKLPYQLEDLEEFVPELEKELRQFLKIVIDIYEKSSRHYKTLIYKI